MKQVTIVIGKTMSGKDTFVSEAVKKGYNRVRTGTTRPQRPTENGTEYLFRDEADPNGIAVRTYEMAGENFVSYWVDKDELDKTENPILIIDLQGAIELIQALPDYQFAVYYINTPIKTIQERIQNSERGKTEDKNESYRRLVDDMVEFDQLDKDLIRSRHSEPITPVTAYLIALSRMK